jgi:hypothetical protein
MNGKHCTMPLPQCHLYNMAYFHCRYLMAAATHFVISLFYRARATVTIK